MGRDYSRRMALLLTDMWGSGTENVDKGNCGLTARETVTLGESPSSSQVFCLFQVKSCVCARAGLGCGGGSPVGRADRGVCRFEVQRNTAQCLFIVPNLGPTCFKG